MKRLGLGLALKYVRTNCSRELTTELYAHECARGVARNSGIVRIFHVTHHVRVFPSDLVVEPKGIVVHYCCYPPSNLLDLFVTASRMAATSPELRTCNPSKLR